MFEGECVGLRCLALSLRPFVFLRVLCVFAVKNEFTTKRERRAGHRDRPSAWHGRHRARPPPRRHARGSPPPFYAHGHRAAVRRGRSLSPTAPIPTTAACATRCRPPGSPDGGPPGSRPCRAATGRCRDEWSDGPAEVPRGTLRSEVAERGRRRSAPSRRLARRARLAGRPRCGAPAPPACADTFPPRSAGGR